MVNFIPFLIWGFEHELFITFKSLSKNLCQKTYQFEHFDWFFWFLQRLWNKHWKFVVELMKFRLPSSSFIVDFFTWTSATLSIITQTLMRHITLGLPFLPTHYFTSLVIENTKILLNAREKRHKAIESSFFFLLRSYVFVCAHYVPYIYLVIEISWQYFACCFLFTFPMINYILRWSVMFVYAEMVMIEYIYR